MYRDKKIALVVPAYNEERLIRPTLESVPPLVDHVYVVDDKSTDNMAEVVREIQKKDPRIELIQHEENQGPGGSIISGYLASARDKYDLTVVVGGDHQMPLEEIRALLDPLIDGKTDYSKGNRFYYWDKTRKKMPKIRIFGNMLITAMTKIASGYYKVTDMVDGYTGITRDAIEKVDWSRAWKKYGYPMDFLIRLNAYGLRVMDVPRTPVYLEGERQSQIKSVSYAFKVAPMIIRGFFWRMSFRYIYRDFHPLVFFYALGMILFPFGLFLGITILRDEWFGSGATAPRSILCALSIMTGVQFLLFGMWFDMEMSKK